MISRAATIDVVSYGEGPNQNGAVQLVRNRFWVSCINLPTVLILCTFAESQMYAELQMLTPMVPSREVYFIRSCKQLSSSQWAIVDVSVEDAVDLSFKKCRKKPSGCIIEDTSNGRCKVLRYLFIMLSVFSPHHSYQS